MTYDEPQTLPDNAFERDGYEFIGWGVNKDATSPEYDNKDTINNLTSKNNETVTIYALWKKTITITYNANGGEGVPATQTGTLYNSQATANIKISSTIPTKEGFTFNGWTDDPDSSEVKYVAEGTYGFSDSTVLYAVWGTNSYTLTVNPNGGTWRGTEENSNLEGKYQETINIEQPTPPAGYTVTFNGNGGEVETTTVTASKKFVEWTEEGPGAINGSLYTFGAGSGALTARYETEKIILPTPVKDGYHCDEWSKDPEGTDPVGKPGEEYEPKDDETLYPVWTANSYTVKLNGNGATSGTMADMNMTYDVSQKIPTNTYVRNNYTFIGWNTDKDGTSAIYQDGETINNLTTENNEIVTLYAMWERTITITYDANNGENAPANQQGVMYNAQATASIKLTEDIPSRIGYSFMGWTDSADSTTVKYQPGGTYSFSNDTTLYAVWGLEKYDLIVNPNGGTWNGSQEEQTIKGDYGLTTEISNPVPPTGHTVTFNGNQGNSEQASIVGTKSFTGWTEDGPGSLSGTTYTFGVGDGTLKANYKDDEITLPNASREGYTFTGWFTATSGGTSIGTAGGKYIPTEDVTLYAQWKINTYNITVDPGDGTWRGSEDPTTIKGDYGSSIKIEDPIPPDGHTIIFDGNGGTTPDPVTSDKVFVEWTVDGNGTLEDDTYTVGSSDGKLTAVYDDEEIILPEPSKDGYTPDHWENEDGEPIGKPGDPYKPTKDETLHVEWLPNTYTISFDGNNATSGSMENLPMIYDQPLNLPTNAFERDGYEFFGWSTNPDDVKAQYTNGQSVSNLTTENNGTVTLYALWKRAITITYDANEGSGAPSSSTGTLYNSQESVTIKLSDTKPTRNGYIFNGWTDIQNSTEVKYQAGGTGVFSDNTTLYAVWGLNNYTLTIDPNGGRWNNTTGKSQVKGDYSTNTTIPDPTAPEGYTVTFEDESGNTIQTLKAVNQFTGWTVEGAGSLEGTTYTFGAGDGYLTANYKKGTIVLPPADKEGYELEEWENEDGDPVGKPGEEYTPQDDETLKPQWKANTYTVILNGNGATSGEMSNLNMTYDKPQALPGNTFKRDGYTFFGWSTNKDATTAQYADKGTVNNLTSKNNEIVELYALWKKTITITYNANGGSGAPSVTTGTIFNAQTSVNIKLSDVKPTREGYSFNGWTITKDSTQVDCQPGGTYLFSNDTTLYAVWGTNSYTLTVNPNGGTWNDQTANSEVKGDYGASTEIANPVPPKGYTVNFNANNGTATQPSITSEKIFTGWTEDGPGNLNGTTYTFGVGDGTLKANYANGEITLPNATREGYTFLGWFTATSEGTSIGGAGGKYTPTANITLYAQWKVNSYNLTVNPNGGTWKGQTSNTVVKGDYGNTTDVPNPTPPKGYTVTFNGNGGTTPSSITATNTFTGWTKEGQGNLSGTTYTFGVGDGSLTANYNKGSIKLPTTDKEGYEINEWENEEGDSVGKPGEEYIPEKDETLTAEWTANIYTIRFDGNGATSGNMSDLSMTYDELKTLSANAYAKTGYKFLGWNTSSTATSVQYSDQQNVKNLTNKNGAVVTLYAIWQKTITISYNANGGEGAPNSQTGVLYNSQASVSIKLSSTKPTRAGYTFNGWGIEEDSSEVKYDAGNTYNFSDNITLYAVWGVNNYTLTVDPNGGTWRNTTNTSKISGDFGTTTAIADPVPPTGYIITFNGNTGTAGQSSITSTKSFSNWTLEGQGSLNGQTYTFGNGDGTITAHYTDNSITLPNATKTGYHCTGWYTSASGGTKRGDVGGSYTPTQSETLYAQWAPNTYTIKFNGNGATGGSMADLSMTYDSAKNLTSNAFTRTGYTFFGWSTNKDATTQSYTNGQNVNNLTATNGETVNLYALWKKTITITYNANGGSGAPGTSTGTLYNAQTSVRITLSTTKPTRSGYTFNGWTATEGSTQVDYQSGGTYSFSNNVTIYAVWGVNSYTLTVNPNGGKWNNTANNSTVSGDYGTTAQISNPTPPTGYKITLNANTGSVSQTSVTSTKSFSSWSKSGSGSLSGTTYTFGTGDGTLTANYTNNSVTLPTPTKTGYHCTGWYTAASGGTKRADAGGSYTPSAAETLYAQWAANTYTIKFNGNGATGGSMADLSMTYDSAKNLTSNAFTRTGYTFFGWSTNKDATKESYTNGQSVNNLTETNGGTVNLYALWKKTVTITYNANGGSGAPASQSGTMYNAQANVSITLSSTKPTRTGYTFLGWNTDKNATSATYASGGSYSFNTDTTLYAIWDANSYKLTVNPNGGTWSGSSSSQSFTQDFGTTKSIPNPTAAPAGYKITLNANTGSVSQTSVTSTKSFSNWTKSGSGSLSGTTYTFGAGDGTLTANYKNNSVTLPTPTKTGYHCTGWYTAASGGTKRADAGGSYTPSAAETLYAQWAANTYTIKFNGNGATGGSMADLSMTYDSAKNLTSNAFTRTGYTFFGWSTNKDATKESYTNGQSVNNLTETNGGTVNLYALWKKTVTVTYNANGGSGAPGASSGTLYNAQANVSITLSGTKPTRTGYTFVGWNTSSTATTASHQPSTAYSFSNNTTLYAVWDANSYTLTVNPSGGTWNGLTNSQSFTQDYGTTKTIANPTPPSGYTVTFNGNNGTAGTSSLKSTKSFSKWTKSGSGSLNGTTYTFGAGAGTLTASYTNNAITLPTATRTGYTFNGWYTAASEGTRRGGAGDSYTPTANETLYAQWSINSYYLDLNIYVDGTLVPGEYDGIYAGLKIGGTDVGNQKDYYTQHPYGTAWEVTGLTINGASVPYGASGTVGAATTSIRIDLYTMTFASNNTNYGTVSTSSYIVPKGATYTTSGTTLTINDGRKVTATVKNTTGYTTKLSSWSPSNGTVNAATKVTANFSRSTNTYTIEFNNNGGSGTMASMSMTYGTPKNLTSNAFTRAGYTFFGWSTNKDATKETYTNGQSVNNLSSTNGETVILYALWKKTVTISYNVNGGSGTITASSGTLYNAQASVSITLSTTKPSRTGYTFNGWSTSSTATSASYQPGTAYSFSNSTTLYAVWGRNSYTVTVNPNGGKYNNTTSNTPITGGYNTTITIANPTPPSGYTVTFNANSGSVSPTSKTSTKSFTGWTEDGPGSLSGITYTFGAGNGTLTANYTNNSITLPTPTRAGYHCTGWNTSGGTKRGDAGGSYTPKQSETLYAQWAANTYTIKFNGNGATSGSMEDLSMTYGTPKNLTSNVFSKTGYTFMGWGISASDALADYSNGQSVNNLTTTNGGIVNLYAIWRKEIKITYSANGGMGEPGSQTGYAYNSDTSTNIILSSTIPTRTGYTFKGWSTSPTATTVTYQPNTLYSFSESTILYAVWDANSYTLTINPNGGTYNGKTENTTVTQDYGTRYTVANPTPPSGYKVTFNGNNGTPETSSLTSTKSFSSWSKSGSGSLSGTTYTFGAGSGTLTASYKNGSITLPNATRAGYQFAGWYTSASGGSRVGGNDSSYTPTATTTLYAHWTPNTYTIKFNGNGATSGSMSNLNMTYDTAKNLTLNKFVKTNYTFLGWNTSSTATTPKYTDGESVENLSSENGATVNLYAIWKVNTYTLTINPNGGEYNGTTKNSTVEGEYNSTITIDNPIPPNGYTITFDGNGGTAEATTVVTRKKFDKWTVTGNGTLNGKEYTFAAENDSIIANYKNEPVFIPSATRSGYTFLGWNTSPTATTALYTPGHLYTYTFNGPTTLYAIWKKVIIIEYDANGGTGAPSRTTGNIYNSATSIDIKLNTKKPTRTGYTFLGWSTSKTATTAKYSAGGTYPFSEDTILYAVWELGVAQIGSTLYPSVQDAVDAVPSTNVKTTVILLVNRTEDFEIPSRKNVKLNLNSKSLTGTALNRGTLEVSNGTMYINTSNSNNNCIENYGTANIIGGTYIANSGSSGIALYPLGNKSSGTMNVTGTVNVQMNNSEGTAIYNEGTLNVTGNSDSSRSINITSKSHGIVSANSNNTAKATVRYATITASTSVQAGNFNSIEDTYGSMEVYNSTLIRTSTTSGKSAISTHDKITTPSAAYTDQLTLYDCTHDNPDMGGFVVEARKDSTGYWAKVYNVKPYTNYQVKFTTTIGSYTKSVIGDDSQDDWQTRINKSDYGNRTGTYKTSIAVINKSTGATTLTLPTLTVDL